MTDIKEEQIGTEAPAQVEGVASSALSDPGPSVEDMAAHDYKNLIPVFYKYIDFMSKKQLKNLMKALVEYPLERDQPKLAYEDERKAFYFGMQIFDCKFVIMKAVMELAKNQENVRKLKAELDKIQEGKRNDLSS